VLLAEHSWPSLEGKPFVLVPVGSLEQHGPHLPLDTDTRIAVVVATAVAGRLRGEAAFPSGVVVAPAIAYGASGEHQDFPGTVSIGADALRTVLIETARSLREWTSGVVFVNAHGGNVPTLTSAIPQLVSEGHAVGWLPAGLPGGDAHAGRSETSIMLYIAPGLVDLDAAEPGNTAPLSQLMPRLTAEGTRAVSPNGILGDPTGASAEEGDRQLSIIIASSTRRVALQLRDEPTGMLTDLRASA
jgi:creatinine amidohydrolase